MISLEGLDAGHRPAREKPRQILRTFARYVRHGLIPNLFPEGEAHGLYHTADATLWFFHALHRYVDLHRRSAHCSQPCFPCCIDIVAWHVRGTDFNIGVDPSDGLLRQGADGYQLTWMDAKVGDWVVTPRRGKAVEIKALWYNALRLIETLGAGQRTVRRQRARMRRACRDGRSASFNARFWYRARRLSLRRRRRRGRPRCALPPQPALRVLAGASGARHAIGGTPCSTSSPSALTPVGLRSLAPGSPGLPAAL